MTTVITHLKQRGAMGDKRLVTLKAAAAEFGVRPNTVSEVAVKRGIRTKPMINGNAKGLDADDMRDLRKVFKPVRQMASSN